MTDDPRWPRASAWLATGAGPIAPTMITSGAAFVNPCSRAHATCITHSAVEVPDRPLTIVTYENDGVPEGWMDVVDVSDPVTPQIVGSTAFSRGVEVRSVTTAAPSQK